MAWNGWFEYGGAEIVNASRTEAYAKHFGASWFKPVYRNTDLVSILGDDRYDTPLQDDAPWTDPDIADSYDFFGCYPLDVGGVEDSTSSSVITESTLDGGVPGRPRRSSKTVVFSLVLVGASEAGVEYGFQWLKQAMSAGPCAGRESSACGGTELCYFSSEPCVDWANCTGDPTDCMDPLLRNLRRIVPTVGPVVTGKLKMTDEGTAWLVSMTLVAGNPIEFGVDIPLLDGFMDPTVNIPYVGGIIPDGGQFDEDGFVQDDPNCPSRVITPIFDPLCPAVIVPPDAPDVDLSCFKFPVNYRRRQATIPRQFIPAWAEVVPLIEVFAPVECRALRLRFYSDPRGDGDPNADPCSFCGDIVFSYIPANSTLVFDGSDEVVYLRTGKGVNRRADSLVFGTDGKPFDWPVLTCGEGYVVTFDLPQTQSPPVVDLTLVPRAA